MKSEEYENNTVEVYKLKESWIRSVKSKVMEHLESVEEARYMVEQANKELDMEDIGVMMDSALEQDKGDCELEERLIHPDFLHLDTDGVEQSDATASGACAILPQRWVVGVIFPLSCLVSVLSTQRQPPSR